ncbi:MAG: ATP-binding protein [Planctomycetota bacterium]|nr:MAG: ATP-binding protein [Planctomycetota bacterium]
MDPRLAVIQRRLQNINRFIAVTGGKGGIGKSFVASALALSLVKQGHRVGLLDLDLTGPCDHLFLGIRGAFPEEDFGILPQNHHGIQFMSVVHFLGEHPAPLRGEDTTQALLELLAITRWGELDYLVLDMPPGLSDATLDAMRFLPGAEFLVVSTPSLIVRETVRRSLHFLRSSGRQVLGVVENMALPGSSPVQALAEAFELRLLARLPQDPDLEAALGDPEALWKTQAVQALAGLTQAW